MAKETAAAKPSTSPKPKTVEKPPPAPRPVAEVGSSARPTPSVTGFTEAFGSAKDAATDAMARDFLARLREGKGPPVKAPLENAIWARHAEKPFGNEAELADFIRQQTAAKPKPAPPAAAPKTAPAPPGTVDLSLEGRKGGSVEAEKPLPHATEALNRRVARGGPDAVAALTEHLQSLAQERHALDEAANGEAKKISQANQKGDEAAAKVAQAEMTRIYSRKHQISLQAEMARQHKDQIRQEATNPSRRPAVKTMDRPAFEATGTALLHGTSRQFDRFDANAPSNVWTRTGGHWFTEKPEVARTFAVEGGRREEISRSSIEEANSRGRGIGNLGDIITGETRPVTLPSGETFEYHDPLPLSQLKAAVAQRLAEGRNVFAYDDHGGLQPVKDPSLLTEDDTETGVMVYPKGQGPRVIETTVYGHTLDLRNAKDWPTDLVKRLQDSSHRWDQGLLDAYRQGLSSRSGDLAAPYRQIAASPALQQYAAEHGIGKIRTHDAHESGFDSYYVPDVRYIGYGQDAYHAVTGHAEGALEGRKGGAVTPEQGVKGGSKAAPPEDKPVELTPEGESWYQRGLEGPKAEKGAAWAWVKRAFAHLTRQFPDLPTTHGNSMIEELLGDRRNSFDLAKNQAGTIIHMMTHGLSRTQIENIGKIFTFKGLEEDLGLWRQEWEDQGNDPKDFDPEAWLPVGLSEADLAANVAQVDAALKSDPKLNGLVIKVRTLREEHVLKPYREVYARVHGREPDLNRQWYMRRLALELAGESGGTGAGKAGQPAQVISPLMRREGGQYMPSTNFIETEMDWTMTMLQHRLDLEIAREVLDHHDIAPAWQGSNAVLNHPDLEAGLKSVARGQALIPAHLPAPGKAHAPLAALGRLAREGRLPDTMAGRFQSLIADLHAMDLINREGAAKGMAPVHLSPEGQKLLPEYAKWMLGEMARHGKMTAAVPKGYMWRDLGNRPSYYQGFSVPAEQALRAIEAGLQKLDVPVEEIRKALLVGRRRKVLIPEGLAKTLDQESVGAQRTPDGWFLALTQRLHNLWKSKALFLPPAAGHQMIANEASDLLATATTAPGMFVRKSKNEQGVMENYIKKAARQVWANRVQGKPPSERLAGMRRVGGGTASQYTQEGFGTSGVPRAILAQAPLRPESSLNAAQKFMQRARVKTPTLSRFGMRFGGGVMDFARFPHEAREEVLRLALYEYNLDHIEKTGNPRTIGAAKLAQVEGLRNDPERMAQHIANATVGAYNKRTPVGRALAKNVFSFYSFQEIVQHRVVRSVLNMLDSPNIRRAIGQKLTGDGWLPERLQPTATRTTELLKTVAMLSAGSALTFAWNRSVYPKETEEMEREFPGRFFLVVGHKDPVTGTIPIYQKLDPVRDFFDGWLGHSAYKEHAREYFNGRITLGEFITDVTAKNWLNQMYQQLRPDLKVFDIAGQRTYPDVFNRQQSREPMEYVSDTITLGGAYRYLKNWNNGRAKQGGSLTPGKAYQLLTDTPGKRGAMTHAIWGSTEVDPLENSYYEAKDDAQHWMKQNGIEPASLDPGEGPRAEAMYQVKKAMAERNQPDQFYWLGQYGQANGTQKGMAISLTNMDPLRLVPETRQEAYVKQLKPDEAMRLRRAYLQWHRKVEPDLDIRGMEKDSLVEFVRNMRQEMKRAIQTDPLVRGDNVPAATADKMRDNVRDLKRRMEAETETPASQMNDAELSKTLGLGENSTAASGAASP